MIKIENSDLTEVLDSQAGILYFSSLWCSPCRILSPIMDTLSEEYEGKVKIAKIDVDANPEASMKYGVRSIPTLLVFKDGKVVETIMGAMPKANIVQRLSSVL